MTLCKRLLAAAVAVVALGVADGAPARAEWIANNIAARRATWFPWHGQYYHAAYGQPVALVVPPTAGNTTEYGWGVAGTRITPIYHQFTRQFPGYGYDGNVPFRATPPWPSDTNQFGVYYVRGPW